MQTAESTDSQTDSVEPKVTNTAQKVTSTEKKPAGIEPKPASTEQKVSIDPDDVNAKTLAQLNTLMEESLQIYELEDQKTNVIDDLHNALQVITQFLGFSANLHPEIFNLPPDTDISLLPNLKIIIKLSNGVESSTLDASTDSPFVDRDVEADIVFWHPQRIPTASQPGEPIKIAEGDYSVFIYLNGYDEDGTTFVRSISLGTVKVIQ